MFFALLLAPMLQNFAAACSNNVTFLGLVPWYRYMSLSTDAAGRCVVSSFDDPNKVLGGQSAFLLIGAAILDDLIRIAAYVSVGYVIYGGIQYITSQGSSDQTKKAQQTIINALIGLAVALIAVVIVTFIGDRLG
jgi:hypothetical protein